MYEVQWWRTSFGDEEVQKLKESVANEHINQGSVTEEFEAQIAQALDVPYALATTSGSAALLMSMMAMGVGQGDEVIVPNRTWIACAHAVLMLGARVVLVDAMPDTPSMDMSQVREKVTSRTKVIMPVHLNGRSVDMEQVHDIAREYGLFVVEDACQALFSRNALGYLGTQSDAGCFSLGLTKVISTGQGGFIVTRNRKTYEAMKLIRNHGVVDNFTDTWNQMGFNFKYTDLQASFGLVQLTRSAARIAHLNEVYRKYASAISEHEFPFLDLIPVQVADGELPLYLEALSSSRDHLMAFLDSRGIQVRPFAPSLHTSDYLDNSGDFSRSDMFHRQGMFLPCGPEQPLEKIDRVIESLRLYEELA